MVGVQGAGLQWVYFLQPNAGVLEIKWKRWPSKYVERGMSVGVRGRSINVPFNNLAVNWTLYEKVNNDNQKYSAKEKARILADQHLHRGLNPYKFADVKVDVKVYLEKLRSLMKDLEKKGVVF